MEKLKVTTTMSDSGWSFSLSCTLGFTLGAPPPTTTVHCGICTEDVPSISIFKTTGRCEHSFCSRCMSSYIVARIQDRAANVRCPGPGCEAVLDPVCCKRLIPSVWFAQWCDLLCKSAVLELPRCSCPNSNCREMIINECGWGAGVGRFKCPSCNQSGWFCDENVHLRERLAKRQQWKRCLQCKIYVERLGGCNKIACRCQTEFCYGCGRKGGPSSCARRNEAREFLINAGIILVLVPGIFLYHALVVRRKKD